MGKIAILICILIVLNHISSVAQFQQNVYDEEILKNNKDLIQQNIAEEPINTYPNDSQEQSERRDYDHPEITEENIDDYYYNEPPENYMNKNARNTNNEELDISNPQSFWHQYNSN
ncbi:MAG: hypothetical protein VW378_00525 [bacterium]